MNLNVNNDNSQLFTLIAFLLGYSLTSNLSSTEQNALGGFFMLVGQTLCTNSGYHFNNEWQNGSNSNNTNDYSKEDTIRILKYANEELSRQINNLSK